MQQKKPPKPKPDRRWYFSTRNPTNTTNQPAHGQNAAPKTASKSQDQKPSKKAASPAKSAAAKYNLERYLLLKY